MKSKDNKTEETKNTDTVIINVAGREYNLRFGRYAMEEVMIRTADNPSKSGFKIVCDIIYAGICDASNLLDVRPPQYGDVVDMVERLQDEPDAKEQIDTVCSVFENSKYGKRLIDDLKSSVEVIPATESSK